MQDYKKIQDKGGFVKRLSELLKLKEPTVQGWFASNKPIKEKYIPIVKEAIKTELESDQKALNIRVVDWEVLIKKVNPFG